MEPSVFHSDQILGGLAISGSEDGTIYFWDLMEGECEAAIQAHEGPVHALEYNGQEHFFTGGGYVRKHCLLCCFLLQSVWGGGGGAGINLIYNKFIDVVIVLYAYKKGNNEVRIFYPLIERF